MPYNDYIYLQWPFRRPMHYVMWHSLLHDIIQKLHLHSHLSIDPWTMWCGIACCIASVCWHYTMTTFTQSPFHRPMHYVMWHSFLHDIIQWLHLPSHLSIDPCTMSSGIACCMTSVRWHYTMATFTCSHLSIDPCTMLCHSLLHDTIQWLHLPSRL